MQMRWSVRDEPRPGRVGLGEYVRRRNGVSLGAAGSLRHMLVRSLGAPSFGAFWRHWNPILGYGLSRYVYAPLRRLMPSAPAMVTTFVVCGALHDAATMIVRRGFCSIVAFAPTCRGRRWMVRAAAHLGYILVCLMLAIMLDKALR